ncbi:MAG: radical SAM protein [Candidatus Saganbacteria bacterium]|nr:radical SAM protein [Candidatus Saganbacteria bacterium]
MSDHDLKKAIENAKREKLKREKPLVYEKIIKLAEKQARGEPTSRIDIGYNYACNLKCKHCMANMFQKKDRSLTLADLRSIAEQADALGWCQFNVSGGEPLILKNFDEVLRALMPEKFHIGISTNGYFLTAEKAKHLKAAGLDKVMISLDSYDEALHNANRASDGAYGKAIAAIWNSKNAGLDTIIQHVITHQNARTDATVKLAQFAQENGFSLDLVIAKALGQWEGRHDVLIDAEDAKFLRELNQKYPAARRDVFPSYGMRGGCGALKGCFHISQYGDVFPCVFMHITIGNVLDEPLKTIVDRGLKIKYFGNRSPICLAGEDRAFIDKYMSRFYGKPLPVDYREIFTEKDDYIQ